MYENSRFLKNRFTFCGVNTNFGQQWAPPAYYHLTPIVSKGKHWMVKHFTATAKGAEALAYGPQQEYIDKYKIYSSLIY